MKKKKTRLQFEVNCEWVLVPTFTIENIKWPCSECVMVSFKWLPLQASVIFYKSPMCDIDLLYELKRNI